MDQKKVLVTGGAGFIGSHIIEALLEDDRVNKVRVLDNFSTGKQENIAPFLSHPNFEFMEGDIRDFEDCKKAVERIDLISHQAALGSVPRSIEDPVITNAVNISGSVNMMTAAKEAGVKRMVLACSSSTYGDHPGLPKQEDVIGKPLSPYALTKYTMELYADIFQRTYGLDYIGLRYFNIYGPRQDPNGPYAAVIPKFCEAALKGEPALINGDGEQVRDFTYVKDAVAANLLALFTADEKAVNQIYNIAVGGKTSLNQLLQILSKIKGEKIAAKYGPERKGDVKASLADIEKAKSLLGYNPKFNIKKGLIETLNWFLKNN